MKERLERYKIFRILASIYRIKAVRILIPIAVIGLVYWEGQKELKQISLGRTFGELRRLPVEAVAKIFLFSLFSVAAMSLYDFMIRRHFRLKVGFWSTFRYSWIANTFNNVIGFAGLTGAGLRTILYKRSGVPPALMASAVVFLSPVVVTGLSILSWGIIAGLFPVGNIMQEHHWLIFAVWGMALYLPLFVLMQRSSLFAKWFNQGEERTPWTTVGISLSASLLEWACAGVTFWLIASTMLHNVPFLEVIGMYAVSAIAGILSMAPGGIGAFDLTVLMGLEQLGFPSERAAAVLVLFRLFYYIVPWLIGLILAAFELGSAAIRAGENADEGEEVPLNVWQRLWRWPGQFRFLSDLGVWALGKLVLVSGLVLILSAATPGLLYRLKLSEEILSMPIMRVSNLISVIIGFMLIILSRGISLRVHRAYVWTSILLLAGAVFTFTKAFDFEEAIFLLIVGVALWMSRARFYRKGAMVDFRNYLLWYVLTAVIAALYYWIGSHVHHGWLKHLPTADRIHFAVGPQAYALTALVGLAGAWLLLTMLLVLRPSRAVAAAAGPEEQGKLRAFLKENQGNLLTHMLFTGDKSFFWAQNDQVLIPYAKVRDKLVVLGDPLGPVTLVPEAIGKFQQYADEYAMAVVFYQATPDYLPIYHEYGYRFFKLGEEALVHLENFTLSGKKAADLRSVRNRFEREGYIFEVASPPFNDALLGELRKVSDEWIKGRREKGYSLGWFDKSYLEQAPIALLKSPEGNILAFASLAPGYDEGRTMSIDLMRHLSGTPNGTMDYLFVKLMEWCKEQGYEIFNLGNAPLSSVGESKSALREERLAALVFQYGGHWYGFKGLRRYKEKFTPEWEPRFLAYPSWVSLPVLTVDLVRLVSRRVPESSK
ncbi:bifunctional lysylphosphatidylglycerol flippase/synthetase MprF [Paenibacillus sp. KQZ6P-2]|uniref:Phosphatidylglycerol lysyltransferase n=1 Tax=Paenibacillus mangrovi TaxID=2931978 RepID=A0A9X1WVV4_9BACL|nr:bifunctional lysylphosphatidylglycerol flippase/synthetase MprF [Paenibacillus mangrovi]MCJ8012889.1 bifunctional lysylphosphatidylglycerol flippase/synthetase MprF [Paenibacillus mangrovi]